MQLENRTQRFSIAARAGLGILLIHLCVGGVCGADQGGGQVYWTTFGPNQRDIERANLDGTDIETLVSGLVSPSGIAIDAPGGKIYWAEQNGRRVARANLDGSDFEVIISNQAGFPADVDLDLDAGKVYWVEFGGTATHLIHRANLDGSSPEGLVPLGVQGNRNGMALDLQAGKIYWTLCAGVIRRANLDGSDVEDLASGLGCLVGIALDSEGGKMYWGDASGAGKIQKANLDGSEIEDLVSGLDQPFGVDLDLAAGHIYWVDRAAEKIQRANLDGSEVTDVLTGVEGLIGIAIDSTPIFSDDFESGTTSAWEP